MKLSYLLHLETQVLHVHILILIITSKYIVHKYYLDEPNGAKRLYYIF